MTPIQGSAQIDLNAVPYSVQIYLNAVQASLSLTQCWTELRSLSIVMHCAEQDFVNLFSFWKIVYSRLVNDKKARKYPGTVPVYLDSVAEPKLFQSTLGIWVCWDWIRRREAGAHYGSGSTGSGSAAINTRWWIKNVHAASYSGIKCVENVPCVHL